MYVPAPEKRNGASVIALHGCTGLWSHGAPGTVAQAAIEKWGRKLSDEGFLVLAVDSYTDRVPSGGDPLAYQVQCAGSPLAGFVDPYTTRVADVDAAIGWMSYRLGSLVDHRVGLIGWSQGAQSVLVRTAETGRFADVSLYEPPAIAPREIPAAVAFYPGCGLDLGFRSGPVTTSYWRPHAPLRVNHAADDPLASDCALRAERALSAFASPWLSYVAYADAAHGFDRVVPTWPVAPCEPADVPDVCAAKDADIASLVMLEQHLLAR